jgi:hypothetical protein
MRPRTQPTSELTPAVVAILLSGWSAKPAEGASPKDGVFALAGGWGVAAPREGEDDDGAFELFQQRDAGVIRLWRRHEAFLRAEAQRLGIRPSWRVGGRLVSLASTARGNPRDDDDADAKGSRRGGAGDAG